MNTAKPIKCLNCDTVMVEGAEHCHHCGQSILEVRLTVKTLLKDIFSQIFNLDGRIFKTLKHLWKPAYLTQEFVGGKRRSYFNPVRFFLIMLLFHFVLLTYTISHSDIDFNQENITRKIVMGELLTNYDTSATTLIPAADSLQLDTLRKKLFGNTKSENQDTIFKNVSIFGTNLKEYGILRKDAYNLSYDSIYAKYNIESKLDRFVIRQTVRINSNVKSLVPFLLGNLTWGVILVLLTISGVLYLLYIRSGYYYVEHAVLQMFYHTKTFFVLNIILIGIILLGSKAEFLEDIFAITYPASILYLLLTMKAYYKQGWIKTIVKFIIVSVSYFFLMLIFGLLVSTIGAAIF